MVYPPTVVILGIELVIFGATDVVVKPGGPLIVGVHALAFADV
jgi:hypothetical protein